jgi:excisionase family DNA binding protein
MTGEDQLISVRDAARECGRNAETVRRWIWSGKLPAEKLGNQLFIRRSILAGYCREMAVHEYKTESHPDFIDKAIALQNKIKARGVGPGDAAETVRKMRIGRLS